MDYPQPRLVASAAKSASVFVVAITNSPNEFSALTRWAGDVSNVRVALGLHPLVAARQPRLAETFARLLDSTDYVGEIGLDFAERDREARQLQVRALEGVLSAVGESRKLLSVHSRKAETVLLDLLQQHRCKHVLFHWYSGSLATLQSILAAGYQISVNPAMVRSEAGRRIVSAAPKEAVVTETDGPFVRVGNRPAIPADVSLVERHLSKLWGLPLEDVKEQIQTNLRQLVRR